MMDVARNRRSRDHRQAHGRRWGWGTQFALVLTLTTILWFVRWATTSPGKGWDDVNNWLDKKELGNYKLLFLKLDLTSLSKCAEVDVNKHNEFRILDMNTRHKLQDALNKLQNEMILEHWMYTIGLDNYANEFMAYGIESLDDLVELTDGTIQHIMSSDETVWAYARLIYHMKLLPHDSIELNHLKQSLWTVAKTNTKKRSWSFGSTALFTVLAGLGVGGATMYCLQERGQVGTSKHSILEYVTGKYLALQHSKLTWDWKDPQTVGKTVTFNIKFFQRNGRPYPITTADNLLIEIILGTTKIPPTVQYGQEVNQVNVAFTVHRAGEYKISVLVGAKHIRGSPFIKTFTPGPIDPSKCGFVGQTSLVVCTCKRKFQLLLEARDEYGNICTNLHTGSSVREDYKLVVTESISGEHFQPLLTINHDRHTGQIIITLTMQKEGCYQAHATYQNEKLKNGQFTLLVLNEQEETAVKKAVAKKSANVFYEARLISANYDKQNKAKKVFCYISPKQITVKEFYLKVIPKRLFTFRVCPSTKMQFMGHNSQYEVPSLVIEDGNQAPIELACKDRNIVAATFNHFLLRNIGGSETFKDKQDFFYHEVRQVHHKRLHERHAIKIARSNLLEGSMKAVKGFSTSDWCKNFEISFLGEEALDWGGVRREWIQLLCDILFDPDGSGLFMRFHDSSQGLVHPRPASRRPAHLKLKHYEFAGKIVGKCLYESALGSTYKQFVNAKFTRSFLAQLIGLRVNYRYFEQDDPDLYTTKIRYIEGNDVEDMDLVFAEEEYLNGRLNRVVDLLPNGSKTVVTDSNKLKYLDCLAQYKLAYSVKDEIDAFLRGLNELIPDNLLSFFDENELELLMCGTGNYSITEFKEHHIISGSQPEFLKVLDWFWTLVSGFTREEMARLLQFTTGCSQLPPGGFAELNPKFQITAAPIYNSLPTAHTCFNQLCLPDYDSMEVFNRHLHTALTEGSQGFGMV